MSEVEKARAAAEHRRDAFQEDLRDLVGIDCGSFTPEGVNRVADLCEQRFLGGGWEVERLGHQPQEGEPQLGDLLIGRLAGPGGPRVLMIGHTDTVFPDGTCAERPFRVAGERAFGPGVNDMKGGLLLGFVAVEILQELGAGGFGSITYICNPDEEIGSPFSGPVIRDLAAAADVAFVLEAARENGDVVSARKGVGDAHIQIVGRAAHAGVEPGRGRSAVLEGAHKVVALHALNGRWPDVTVNAGVIQGGTRPNVVAERCAIEVDVRSPQRVSLKEAMAEVARIAGTHTVPDVEASLSSRSFHLPMEKTPASQALVDLAREVAAELGFPLSDTSTGGGSDGNTTAAAGVPTLDGLGPIGGKPHSSEEWMDLASVPDRVALLAGLIARAGG